MIHTICIGKARDDVVISKYKLKDFNNQVSIIDAEVLKNLMKDGKISVANLTLTSDKVIIS